VHDLLTDRPRNDRDRAKEAASPTDGAPPAGGHGFWDTPTIAQFIHERGLEPVRDPRDLIVEGLTAEDWAELREAIER
jgi:hypothetical protein